jgi:hypothetical protein
MGETASVNVIARICKPSVARFARRHREITMRRNQRIRQS